jgi:transposase
MNQSECSRALQLGRGTVQEYWWRFDGLNISWNEAEKLSDDKLEERLYPAKIKEAADKTQPDFAYIHKELRRAGVTMTLLWEEYIKEHPQGYRHSQFGELYRRWKCGLRVYMRQHHTGGEKIYVDYSGKKPFIIDRITGEIKPVDLFVIAWGASHYLYAEAQESQQQRNFIMGHVRGFEYFGCVPFISVPDNYKGAVDKAHRYDPDINHAYSELAAHYGFGVLPARARRPKDKSKVEVGVQIVQRWILARLRNRQFFSIEELNRAIWELLDELNQKPMKKLGKSRLELFESIDKPNAKPLPVNRYIYHEWAQAKVNIDYHIEVQRNYYSAPYTYYGKTVDARITESLVEIFYKGSRIASHPRKFKEYGYATDKEHMPESHRKHAEWTPNRLIDWAKKIGVYTGAAVEKIISSRTLPEQGFRPALGIIRLGQTYGNENLEQAIKFAGEYSLYRVQYISDILKKGLYREKEKDKSPGAVKNVINVRGAEYYTGSETAVQPAVLEGVGT